MIYCYRPTINLVTLGTGKRTTFDVQYVGSSDMNGLIVEPQVETSLAMVVSLKLSSRSYEAGVRMGDIVTAVNGQPIFSYGDFPELVASMGWPLALR